MSNAAYPVIDAFCGIDGASPQISQYTKDFNKIKFMLGKNLDGYTLMIVTDINGHVEIVKTDGVNLVQEKDTTTGETSLLWNIGSNITVTHGVVVYQIVGYKSQNDAIVSTWYSKEGRLLVTESIDTTTYSAELMGSHPNLITQLIAECGEVKTKCEQKVDKEDGKGLSTCDFTPDEKEKLATVAKGANPNVQANWNEDDESSDAYIIDKPDIDGEVRKTENLVTNFAVATKFEEVAEATTNEIHTATQEAKDYTSQVQTELHGHINETDGIDKKHLTSAELADVRDIPRIIAGDKMVGLAETAWNADKAFTDEKGNVIHEAYATRREIETGDLWAMHASLAMCDLNDNVIHETYATKEEVMPEPEQEIPATLEPNKAYNFGSASNITLTFPSVANDGDVIYVGFICRGTTNLVVDTTNTYDFDLVPEEGVGYEIYAKCNTAENLPKWIVKYSEYTGAGD